jgi:hypothetical protein
MRCEKCRRELAANKPAHRLSLVVGDILTRLAQRAVDQRSLGSFLAFPPKGDDRAHLHLGEGMLKGDESHCRRCQASHYLKGASRGFGRRTCVRGRVGLTQSSGKCACTMRERDLPSDDANSSFAKRALHSGPARRKIRWRSPTTIRPSRGRDADDVARGQGERRQSSPTLGNCLGLGFSARRMDHCLASLLQYLQHLTQ